MKKIASVRFVLVGFSLSLIIQTLAWLLFDSSVFFLIALLLAQITLGMLIFWLAIRHQRATSKLETLLKKSQSEYGKILASNTNEVRRLSQVGIGVDTHPRELRAIDDVSAIREQMTELNTDVTKLRIVANQLIRQANERPK